VTFQTLHRAIAVGLLMGGLTTISAAPGWGQEAKAQESGRKAKIRVPPVYPELARRMNITGVVKVRVTVAANGTVKDATLVGGHPVLAAAALDAAKKWHFESRQEESTEIVEFRFDPTQ